jgi:hypothetical protein
MFDAVILKGAVKTNGLTGIGQDPTYASLTQAPVFFAGDSREYKDFWGEEDEDPEDSISPEAIFSLVKNGHPTKLELTTRWEINHVKKQNNSLDKV